MSHLSDILQRKAADAGGESRSLRPSAYRTSPRDPFRSGKPAGPVLPLRRRFSADGLLLRLPLLLLLCLLCCFLPGGSRADALILAGTGDDAAALTALLPEWTLREGKTAVCVLQKTDNKTKKALDASLTEAGASFVSYAGCPALKASQLTQERLEKSWLNKDCIARAASAARNIQADTLIFYAQDPVIQAFLPRFAESCAQSAWDPAVRDKDNKEDQYLTRIRTLRDGITGEETAAALTDPRMTLAETWGEALSPELPGLPETDAEGFLLAGDEPWFLADEEAGVWAWIDHDLRILITRRNASKLQWYEADIRRRENGDALHILPSSDGKGKKPQLIAQEGRAVLAINTDYYHYRVSNKLKTGLIIRDSQVLYESSGPGNLTKLPSLDTLMLTPSGGFDVSIAGELDSAAALAAGARDVLSFGPALIDEGKYRVLLSTYRIKKEPRTAIGMIGPNHYLVVVAEGRMSRSQGMSLDQLQQLMYVRGCTEAINLDGGHTSALFFMGRRLNLIGNLSGSGTTGPRSMTELLALGTVPESIPLPED